MWKYSFPWKRYPEKSVIHISFCLRVHISIWYGVIDLMYSVIVFTCAVLVQFYFITTQVWTILRVYNRAFIKWWYYEFLKKEYSYLLLFNVCMDSMINHINVLLIVLVNLIPFWASGFSHIEERTGCQLGLIFGVLTTTSKSFY